MIPALRIHDRLEVSTSNGPGKRAVIWVQGCTLACPGCFNPRTHDPALGILYDIPSIMEWLTRIPDIEGLTISGGEPLQQMPALLLLIQSVRSQTNLSIVLFSGYTYAEILDFSDYSQLIANIDILIAGRYHHQESIGKSLLGSVNQSIHFFTQRYSPEDIERSPESEMIIHPDGTIQISGIAPLHWE